MKGFLDDNFLLKTETAQKLFHKSASELPIIDYHCHVNPREIAEDKTFKTITEIWLYGDHYKWRAMRACGVCENKITGSATDYEKFFEYARIMPKLIGNPLYHWSHLELKKYFGVTETLNEQTAEAIYKRCNEQLECISVQKIIKQSNVEVICTTDDPDSSLEYHKAIKQSGFSCSVILPTFRPDRILKNDAGLSKTQLLSHLEKRLDYFVENGCKLSDHGVSDFSDTELLLETAKLYNERGVAMQIHFNAVRNVNEKMFGLLGADTGFDTIYDNQSIKPLANLLSELDKCDKLPKTVIYSLNPSDNGAIASLCGCFRDVLQGSAWWFNDSIKGMVEQMTTLASVYPLGKFLGMLTDSRSFLSYTRHEYFRRIFCDILGDWVENGEFPNDVETLEKLVVDVCYENAKSFFRF